MFKFFRMKRTTILYAFLVFFTLCVILCEADGNRQMELGSNLTAFSRGLVSEEFSTRQMDF